MANMVLWRKGSNDPKHRNELGNFCSKYRMLMATFLAVSWQLKHAIVQKQKDFFLGGVRDMERKENGSE